MILVSFCDKNNKINNYLSTPSTQVQKELSKYKNYFIPYSSANIRSAEAFKHSVHTCNVKARIRRLCKLLSGHPVDLSFDLLLTILSKNLTILLHFFFYKYYRP